MNKLILSLLIISFSLSYNAQSESEIIDFASRICTTDSVSTTLGYNIEEDTIKRFDFITPNLPSIENPVYEFDNFILDINLSSTMLFNDTPYGKFYILNFSKKEAKVLVLLSGAGDRVKDNLWNYAVFSFTKQKKGKWFLEGVEYKYGTVDSELLGE